MLFEFGKMRRLRFISHLDLQRFMQRALRRTGLPVSYTQGFNPHAHMAFASALAMGQESRCELLDVKMESRVTESEAFQRMAAALPPDMPLLRVREVIDTHPSLMSLLTAADYEIIISGPGAQETARAVSAFLLKEEHIALRRTKSGEKPTDIRPLALKLEAVEGMGEGVLLRARLMLTERATLKPELLLGELYKLAELDAPPPACEIVRVRLLASENGALSDLFDYDRAF